MKSIGEKIEDIVENRRVKLHVFEPSNRSIWTVIGIDQEYWVEPDLEFCSCAGYYFSRLGMLGGRCYHLESLRTAISQEKHETIKFDDHEYGDFVSSLIANL